MSDSQVLTEGFTTFPVHELSHFKTVSLQSGQYLARKIEKGTGLVSKAVVVPALTQEEVVKNWLQEDSILEEITSYCQSLQEEVIKTKIAAGATSICTADLEVSNVVSYLQNKAIAEGKVSKEKIAAWFSSSVASPLISAFETKLGASLSEEKKQQLLKVYSDAFSKFAAKEYSFNNSTYENVSKVLALIPDSAIKTFCLQKLPQMKEKGVDEFGL